MIVQIMAYDPNFYKEHTLVFSDIYFPQFEQKVYMDPKEYWTQFRYFQEFHSDDTAVRAPDWLQFSVFNLHYLVESEVTPDIWTYWNPTEGWTSYHDYVQLEGIQGWTDFFLPETFQQDSSEASKGTNYGRMHDQRFEDAECQVLPTLIQTVTNELLPQYSSSYPVTDNHIVEVFTTYIDIKPSLEASAKYQPSTY